MKKFPFCLLFLFMALSSIVSYGQNATIDSILQVLKSAKEDTNKVNLLNKIALLYSDESMDRGLDYCRHALTLATKLNRADQIAEINFTMGLLYENKSDYSKAIEYLLQAAQIFKLSNIKLGFARSNGELGNVYYNKADYPNALRYYLMAVDGYDEIGNKKGVAANLGNIGSIYWQLNDNANALDYYERALKIKKEIGNKNGTALTLANIGNVYFNQKMNQKALEYYQMALKLLEELGNKSAAGGVLACIGSTYAVDKNYTKAIESQLSGLKLQKEAGFPNEVAVTYNNIGSIYLQAAKHHDHTFLRTYFGGIGFSEKALCLEKARSYIDSGIIIHREVGNMTYLIEEYQDLSEIQSLLGEDKAALDSYKLYSQFKDSVFNTEKDKKLTQLAMQSEFEKKEAIAKSEREQKDKEIQLLQKDNELNISKLKAQRAMLLASKLESDNKENAIRLLNSSNAFRQLQLTEAEQKIAYQQAEAKAKVAELEIIRKDKELNRQKLDIEILLRNGIFIGLGLILLSGIFVFRNLQLRRHLEKQQAVAMERKRISTDLHDDVGSTLSSIRIMSTVAVNNPKESAALLKKISENAQRMLENISDIVWMENPDHDSFDDILARMNQYASQVLEPKNIKFRINSEIPVKDIILSSEQRRNVYLIFKEAMNNLAKYSACTKVDIAISQSSKSLVMRISDDGKGFDVRSLSDNNQLTGNGLKNMQKRAENMRGELELNSKLNQGTTIQLKIPIT